MQKLQARESQQMFKLAACSIINLICILFYTFVSRILLLAMCITNVVVLQTIKKGFQIVLEIFFSYIFKKRKPKKKWLNKSVLFIDRGPTHLTKPIKDQSSITIIIRAIKSQKPEKPQVILYDPFMLRFNGTDSEREQRTSVSFLSNDLIS